MDAEPWPVRASMPWRWWTVGLVLSLEKWRPRKGRSRGGLGTDSDYEAVGRF